MTAIHDDTPSKGDIERQLVTDLNGLAYEPMLRALLTAAWTKGLLFGLGMGFDGAKAEVAKLLAEERER